MLPTVIIEALASGRPVLGTALGGIPYLVGADTPREPAGTGPAAVASAVAGHGLAPLPTGVVTGTAGWVVPPEPAALAAALPVARAGAAALSAPARLRYEQTFHPDVVTKRLIDIYAGVARPDPGPSGHPEGDGELDDRAGACGSRATWASTSRAAGRWRTSAGAVRSASTSIRPALTGSPVWR